MFCFYIHACCCRRMNKCNNTRKLARAYIFSRGRSALLKGMSKSCTVEQFIGISPTPGTLILGRVLAGPVYFRWGLRPLTATHTHTHTRTHTHAGRGGSLTSTATARGDATRRWIMNTSACKCAAYTRSTASTRATMFAVDHHHHHHSFIHSFVRSFIHVLKL